jgi:hypothetical protein
MTARRGHVFRPSTFTDPAAPSRQSVPRWAVICAALSPVLLTAAYLVAGMLQPSSYNPIRQTISAMAGYTATDRWIMNAGIILVGACYLLTAAGLTALRASARVLLAIAGLAGIGIAASPESAGGPSPQHLAWAALPAPQPALGRTCVIGRIAQTQRPLRAESAPVLYLHGPSKIGSIAAAGAACARAAAACRSRPGGARSTSAAKQPRAGPG